MTTSAYKILSNMNGRPVNAMPSLPPSRPYASIRALGNNSFTPSDDPLAFCVGNNGLFNQIDASKYKNSPQCQAYMSSRCAQKWDGYCQLASLNATASYPNNLANNPLADKVFSSQTISAGEILIRNTAAKKYRADEKGIIKKCEPFDPLQPNSPDVCYDIPVGVIAYEVDPKTIDADPVMTRILTKPEIAADILVNIYNTMKRKNTLSKLKSTRLGSFFESEYFRQLYKIFVPK